MLWVDRVGDSCCEASLAQNLRSVHLDEVWVGLEDGSMWTPTMVSTWRIMNSLERAVAKREPQRTTVADGREVPELNATISNFLPQ
jgi:hypothetical protein